MNIRMTLFGAFFGLMFPISAWIVDIISQDLTFSSDSIIQIHSDNLVHYIVDLAPIVLATIFFFLGKALQAAVLNLHAQAKPSRYEIIF